MSTQNYIEYAEEQMAIYWANYQGFPRDAMMAIPPTFQVTSEQVQATEPEEDEEEFYGPDDQVDTEDPEWWDRKEAEEQARQIRVDQASGKFPITGSTRHPLTISEMVNTGIYVVVLSLPGKDEEIIKGTKKDTLKTARRKLRAAGYSITNREQVEQILPEETVLGAHVIIAKPKEA